MSRFPLKIGDILVLTLAILLVTILVVQSFGESSGGLVVRIEGQDQSWLYPLDAEVEIAVNGPLGDTYVHLYGGSVWVEKSPCRQKICIAAGSISNAGAFIACLPNRVLVRIEGKREGEVDDLAF